jgi:hypothetical protein
MGEFINCSRLVYPIEREAMRFLNVVANKVFSRSVHVVALTGVTDTLCGAKILRRSDYIRLKADRSQFGDFDPFGDFDLIFGAVKLNLKVLRCPTSVRGRIGCKHCYGRCSTSSRVSYPVFPGGRSDS